MSFLFMLAEGVAPMKRISFNDIFFYIILGILVVVVFYLCFLYTRSDKYKIKKRKELEQTNIEYQPAKVIKVEQQKEQISKE